MLHRPLTFPKYASYILIIVAVSFNISLNLLVINELYMKKDDRSDRKMKTDDFQLTPISIYHPLLLSSFYT